MNQFERPLSGFRFVETYYGDTLQRIAARELGDASRWVDLVHLNGLIPPYFVDISEPQTDGVIRYGDQLLVPSSTSVSNYETDPNLVFGIDCELRNGFLEAEDGDFCVVSAFDNLKQAIKHRIVTDQGELVFHPDYRCLVHRLIGAANGPTAGLLARDYVKSAILRDPRIQEVTSVVATISGDKISVTAEAVPVTGRKITVEV